MLLDQLRGRPDQRLVGQRDHAGQHETRDDILRKSLQEAVTSADRQPGQRYDQVVLGRLCTPSPSTTRSARSSPLDKLLNFGPFPMPGDGNTVNAGGYRIGGYAYPAQPPLHAHDQRPRRLEPHAADLQRPASRASSAARTGATRSPPGSTTATIRSPGPLTGYRRRGRSRFNRSAFCYLHSPGA